MRQKGFTFLELMVAIAIMLVVMAAAVSLYQKSAQVSASVNQQSDMQAEVRAAVNQLSRDLNQAGTGIPIGGIPIPSATTGTNPRFACDGTTCYITAPSNQFTQGLLYKVTPANGVGLDVVQPSDAIVITYLDPVLSPMVDPHLCNPNPDCNWSSKTTTAVVTDGSGSVVTMPTGMSPAMDDPRYGLFVGDVLLLQNGNGSAVGVVTGLDFAARKITFANNDPLNINQSGATGGNIAALNPATSAVSVSRVIVITYFIQQTPNGASTQLMRQIGAKTPTPVADHIEDLQFTYDIIDTNTSVATVNLADAAIGSPLTPVPNQIRKVNISITVRSPRPNAQGEFDHLSLTTSIGPRNLSFQDRYHE